MDKNRRTGIIRKIILCMSSILWLICLSGCTTTMLVSEIKHPPEKTDWLYDIERAFSNGKEIAIIFRGSLATAHPSAKNNCQQYWLVFSKYHLVKNGSFDYAKECGQDMIICNCQLDRTHLHKGVPQNIIAGWEEIKVLKSADDWKTFYSQSSFQDGLFPSSRLAVLFNPKNKYGKKLCFKIIELPSQKLCPTCYRITVSGEKDILSIARSVVLIPFAVVVDIIATPLQLIFGKT